MCFFPEKTSLGYASMLTHSDSERENSRSFSHSQKQISGYSAYSLGIPPGSSSIS